MKGHWPSPRYSKGGASGSGARWRGSCRRERARRGCPAVFNRSHTRRPIKTLAFGTLLSLAVAGGAQAQSQTAYDSANCNASFLRNCTDGGNSDAPLPLLGASPLALAALGAAAYMRRRRRLKAVASAA